MTTTTRTGRRLGKSNLTMEQRHRIATMLHNKNLTLQEIAGREHVSMATVSLIAKATEQGRQRKWTAEEKADILIHMSQNKDNCLILANKYGVTTSKLRAIYYAEVYKNLKRK